jgi:DNA-binding transcriptional MerR regulator
VTVAAVPEVRCFTAKEVRELAGVTYRQLDYWTRNGHIRSNGLVGLGSGNNRAYTLAEVIEIAVMERLIRPEIGFTVQAAARLASAHRREHWETG